MAVKAVTYQNYQGGWSTDQRLGIKNSFVYSQALDFRKSPSQLSVLPGLTREDNNIVKDLILNEVMLPNGNIWAYGDAGYIYERSATGVQSTFSKLGSGTGGIDYRYDNDTIYLCSNKTVSTIINASLLYGSALPSLQPDIYGASISTYNNSTNAGFNVSALQTNSSLTTAILVATSPLTEGSTSIRYFQSDIEPLSKVSLFVTSKGSGDWTVTIHDGNNTFMNSSTVTNANLVNGQFNDFVFSNQTRLYVSPNARTYHIHVTSTVADGTVSSSVTNDLSSCDLEIWADRLVQTVNGLHPMGRFLQYEVIGNGNYLSAWEPLSPIPTNTEWQRHRLVFPMEYEVCGVAFTNEFTVVAAEQVVNKTLLGLADGVRSLQMGQLFFWDGISTGYNYNVPIPEGSPQALHTYKNVAYYYAGGDWWAITSPLTQPVKMRSMPGSATEFSGTNSTISLYPYSATVRRNVHLMGYPGKTTNTGVNFGVYSWGAVDKNYPETFGYSYLLSTGSQNYSASNSLQIGMVKNFGDLLHVSWRDTLNGGYGLDAVDNSSKPATAWSWQSLIFDNGYVAKYKTGLYVEGYWTALPAGSTITLMYNIDQSGWVSGDTFSSTNLWQGQTGYGRFNIDASDTHGGRFHEIQVGFSGTSDATVTSPPIIAMVSLVFEDNHAEAMA